MSSLLAIALAVAAGSQLPPPLPRPEPPPRLLVLDLRDDGAGPEIVGLLRDVITTHIARASAVEVLSTEDVRRLVDLESQKVATCTGDAAAAAANCLAEIGQALGARYVVYGNVGALGSATVVNVSLAHAEKGVTLSRALVQSATREALPREVAHALDGMLLEAGLAAGGGGDTGELSPLVIIGSAGGFLGFGLFAGGSLGAFLADGVVADITSSKADKDVAESNRTAWTVAAVAGAVVAVAGATLATVPLVLE